MSRGSATHHSRQATHRSRQVGRPCNPQPQPSNPAPTPRLAALQILAPLQYPLGGLSIPFSLLRSLLQAPPEWPVSALCSPAVSRVAMGGVCDRWGPRYGAAALLLLTSCASFGAPCRMYCRSWREAAPQVQRLGSTTDLAAVSCWTCAPSGCACTPLPRPPPSLPWSPGMTAVSNAAGYIAVRLLIGTALACFVTCQFWCSVMFTPRWWWGQCACAGGGGSAFAGGGGSACAGVRSRQQWEEERGGSRRRSGSGSGRATAPGVFNMHRQTTSDVPPRLVTPASRPAGLQDRGDSQRCGRGVGQLCWRRRAAAHAAAAQGKPGAGGGGDQPINQSLISCMWSCPASSFHTDMLLPPPPPSPIMVSDLCQVTRPLEGTRVIETRVHCTAGPGAGAAFVHSVAHVLPCRWLDAGCRGLAGALSFWEGPVCVLGGGGPTACLRAARPGGAEGGIGTSAT